MRNTIRESAISNEEKTGRRSSYERVDRAAERLLELMASGVELFEILGGPAGASFVHNDCYGDRYRTRGLHPRVFPETPRLALV
jgi:hypothetical protein